MGCLLFLYLKLDDQLVDYARIELPIYSAGIISLVCLLMIINWYLEALRWKYSIQTFEAISIKEACKAVLAGLALNWVLPFTSGDLIARIAKHQDKYQATSAAMLNRGIMLLLTFLLGSYGASKLVIRYEWDEGPLEGFSINLEAYNLTDEPFVTENTTRDPSVTYPSRHELYGTTYNFTVSKKF